MSLLSEESKREKEMRQALEDAGVLKSTPQRRASRAKEKEERARKDYEQKQKTLEYKRERLEWQKQRSKIKDEEKKEAEKRRKSKSGSGSSNIKIEPITDKDRDPTAYKKAIGGMASFGKAAITAGTKAAIDALRKKRQEKAAQRQADAQDKAERSIKTQQVKTKAAISQSTRLLPGSRSGETSGQRARRDLDFKKREILKRGGTTTEEFSCWREEFLYELGDMRRKKKKDKDGEDRIIDVMKGTNTVVIGPDIKEEYLDERKRDHLANTLLGLAFASNVAQSPEALVRSGHIEAPGMQLMSKMMQRRKEANRNLDSGRVSHPSRNIKRNKVKEEVDKDLLIKTIIKKLIDEKKRKNSLINNKYIGESSKTEMKCNKPQRAPKGATQKYIVKACDNNQEKIVRFGYRGMQDFLQHKNEERRKNFKARHRCSEKNDKLTPGWWACNYNW